MVETKQDQSKWNFNTGLMWNTSFQIKNILEGEYMLTRPTLQKWKTKGIC